VGGRTDRAGHLGHWQPDLVHLHDWQAALTAALPALRSLARARPATLLTIHNLAFQGLFGADACAHSLSACAAAALDVDGMEYWGNLSFLKAGVRWADRRQHGQPHLRPRGPHRRAGHGLRRVAACSRPDGLTGIVNGIDDAVWNPATDPALVAQYSVRRLHAKATNKAALQAELQLEARPGAPLFCVVSRLSTQKGLDLLLAALPRLLARGAQLAVLGTGERALEDGLRRAAPTTLATSQSPSATTSRSHIACRGAPTPSSCLPDSSPAASRSSTGCATARCRWWRASAAWPTP
jgi:starch synthase